MAEEGAAGAAGTAAAAGGDSIVPPTFRSWPTSIFQFVQIRGKKLGEEGYVLE